MGRVWVRLGTPGWDAGSGRGQNVVDSMGGHVGMAARGRGDSETRLYRPQSALGIQQQAVGSTETEVFVIKRAVRASGGARTVWHCSFLPSG